MIRAHRHGICLLAVALAACGGQRVMVEEAEGFEMLRDGGYRLAVLPFAVSASQDGALTEALGALGGLLALDGLSDASPPFEQAATVMRRALVAALDGGTFQVAELWVTDTRLRHAGLGTDALSDVQRGAELARLLDVDGVVFGEVTEWNRGDHAAQSLQSVGLRVRLVDRRSNEVIFESQRSEDRGSGLTGGPTGHVLAATEPIAGLESSTLAQLARAVARHSASDLTGMRATDAVDLGAAMGGVPVLSFHAVMTERDGPLTGGDRLRVVAIGTADCEARFDIGRYRADIPMVQVARTDDPRGARATYVGHYAVQSGEKLGRVPVFVSLSRRVGGRVLRSRHRLAGVMVAIE